MAPELVHALTSADHAAIGKRIRSARLAAGLTQPQLAGSDVSVAFLSRVETGQRRPSAALLELLATKLGVSVDYLIIGESWEEARRLELQLDHAELSLVGGEARLALDQALDALSSVALAVVPGGLVRARYVEAAALDALGAGEAAAAFEALLTEELDANLRIRAVTALSRIWREQGQLERAIACAQSVLADLPSAAICSEEGIRLSVTLAAGLFEAGRTEEAASLCDRAIAESERLSSPVARASAYWNASVIRAEAGDVGEALSLAKRALHLLESTERVRDLARLRTQLSSILLRSDPPRLDDAREQLTLADTELDWSQASPADRARNDLINAQASLLAGDHDEARARADAVVAAAEGVLPLVTVNALTLLGQIAWALEDHEEARGRFRQAIAVLTGVGADREAAQLWFDLGGLATEAGLTAEAADAYRRAAASTGLTARLPVITRPVATPPRATPGAVPAGRV